MPSPPWLYVACSSHTVEERVILRLGSEYNCSRISAGLLPFWKRLLCFYAVSVVLLLLKIRSLSKTKVFRHYLDDLRVSKCWCDKMDVPCSHEYHAACNLKSVWRCGGVISKRLMPKAVRCVFTRRNKNMTVIWTAPPSDCPSVHIFHPKTAKRISVTFVVECLSNSVLHDADLWHYQKLDILGCNAV
jgi:hypothetical protein